MDVPVLDIIVHRNAPPLLIDFPFCITPYAVNEFLSSWPFIPLLQLPPVAPLLLPVPASLHLS